MNSVGYNCTRGRNYRFQQDTPYNVNGMDALRAGTVCGCCVFQFENVILIYHCVNNIDYQRQNYYACKGRLPPLPYGTPVIASAGINSTNCYNSHAPNTSNYSRIAMPNLSCKPLSCLTNGNFTYTFDSKLADTLQGDLCKYKDCATDEIVVIKRTQIDLHKLRIDRNNQKIDENIKKEAKILQWVSDSNHDCNYNKKNNNHNNNNNNNNKSCNNSSEINNRQNQNNYNTNTNRNNNNNNNGNSNSNISGTMFDPSKMFANHNHSVSLSSSPESESLTDFDSDSNTESDSESTASLTGQESSTSPELTGPKGWFFLFSFLFFCLFGVACFVGL